MNAPRPDYTDLFTGDCSNCNHDIELIVPIETISTSAWVTCSKCSHINNVDKVVQ